MYGGSQGAPHQIKTCFLLLSNRPTTGEPPAELTNAPCHAFFFCLPTLHSKASNLSALGVESTDCDKSTKKNHYTIKKTAFLSMRIVFRNPSIRYTPI